MVLAKLYRNLQIAESPPPPLLDDAIGWGCQIWLSTGIWNYNSSVVILTYKITCLTYLAGFLSHVLNGKLFNADMYLPSIAIMKAQLSLFVKRSNVDLF